MGTFFAYIASSELASGDDPVDALRTAATRAVLVSDPSFDPNGASSWARADVAAVEAGSVNVTNQNTGQPVPARICTMRTSS